MAERFAFVTGKYINLLLDEAVPENTKKIPSYAVRVFDGIVYLGRMFKLTQACCEISHAFNYRFHSVQQSFN